MIKRVALALVAVGVVLAFRRRYLRSLQPVGPELITNGSFENNRQDWSSTGESRMALTEPTSKIQAWEVMGTVAWSNETATQIHPADGDFFVELRNRNPNNGTGGVSQVTWLKSDTYYELKFQVGTLMFSGEKKTNPVAIRVDIDGGKPRSSDPNSSKLSLGPRTFAAVGGNIQWQETSFTIDTEMWRPNAGTMDQYEISIVAPSDLNAGRSLAGIDSVSLRELSGTLFRRL